MIYSRKVAEKQSLFMIYSRKVAEKQSLYVTFPRKVAKKQSLLLKVSAPLRLCVNLYSAYFHAESLRSKVILQIHHTPYIIYTTSYTLHLSLLLPQRFTFFIRDFLRFFCVLFGFFGGFHRFL